MSTRSVHLAAPVLAVLLSACASSATYTDRDYCKATVNPALARVVLTAGSYFMGGGARIAMTDNGQPVGWVTTGAQLCWDRYPGFTRIVAAKVGGLQFEAKAGQVYEVSFTLSDGLALVSTRR